MSTEIERNRKLLLLSGCFLFNDLCFDELDQLVENTGVRNANTNEVIFRKCETGKEMFVIVSGKVSLTSTAEQGKSLCLGVLGEGNIFGEISLFDNQERTATITALEPTQLLVLEQAHFVSFINNNPKTAIKLLGSMAMRLRYADQFFENIIFGHLHIRIARKMLSLAKVFGETTDDGVYISIALSANEISKMLGASCDKVDKQLKAWEKEGIILSKQGHIVLVKPETLSKLV